MGLLCERKRACTRIECSNSAVLSLSTAVSLTPTQPCMLESLLGHNSNLAVYRRSPTAHCTPRVWQCVARVIVPTAP